MVTKKASTNADWILNGDIRVRFPSKRSAITAYEQQRAHVKGHGDSESRILTHDGQISQTLIPTRHVGSESSEASLHKVFVSCEMLRGKDIGELPTLFRDNMKDSYEDLILNNNDDFQTPADFIEIFIEGIATAEAQGETTVTLSPKDTLYRFEFYRIFKVGGIASPYATI